MIKEEKEKLTIHKFEKYKNKPTLQSVSKPQMSAARHHLDWSAASTRLLFDGDDAILHNTVRMPSGRVHSSLPPAVAGVLCGRTLSRNTDRQIITARQLHSDDFSWSQ